MFRNTNSNRKCFISAIGFFGRTRTRMVVMRDRFIHMAARCRASQFNLVPIFSSCANSVKHRNVKHLTPSQCTPSNQWYCQKSGIHTVRMLCNKVHSPTSTAKIRNIGIMAHIDAGKTTTTERMLYYAGFSKHLGDVDHGDTVMDYMEQERDRGITITSAAITFNWLNHKMNLIDTPGHVDFTVEVERSLRVLDGAIAVLDASAGVEAQTTTVWRQADNYRIPRIVFLNKMDKPGASLQLCLQSLEEKLAVKPLVLNMPIASGRNFVGIHDLVHQKTLIWDDKTSRNGEIFQAHPFSESGKFGDVTTLQSARSDLIGQLADLDENIANLVLNDVSIEDFPDDLIKDAIRSATIQQKVVPILCGSSLKNKGVQPLLDAITFYLPSPEDISSDFVQYYGGNLCALAFKVTHDKQRGPLTFTRIYSGTLKSGSQIYNVNQSVNEKTSRLLQVFANELHDIPETTEGNIVAIAGFKQTVSGDTITSNQKVSKDASKLFMEKKGKQVQHAKSDSKVTGEQTDDEDEKSSKHDAVPVLAGLQVPDPVFFCSVEPASMLVQSKLEVALDNLQKEDPSLKVEVNTETGQTILSGMGELHLDIIQSRLANEYGLDVDFGPLQIAYRETIEESATVTEVLDKALGGKQQFVHMKLTIHPDMENRDFKHIELIRTTDDPLPIKFKVLKAIESGIKSGLGNGSLLNFPVIHARVSLHEFSTTYHTTLPMISACAAMAVQKALKQANATLLEPMMKMEITVPEEMLDPVMADLGHRRSHILNVKALNLTKVVSAETPLQSLVGFSTDLRTITSGTAICSMQLSHYEKVNSAETQNVIARISGFHFENR